MNCAEVREEFSALLDGELPPETRATVEAHLSECADCLRELDALKRVDTLYRRLPAQSAPADFESRVRGALRPRSLPFPRLQPRRLWPVLAAAAAVLVVVGGTLLRQSAPTERFDVATVKQEEEVMPQAAAPEVSSPAISESVREQLKAMGYLDAESKRKDAMEQAAPPKLAMPEVSAPAEERESPAQGTVLHDEERAASRVGEMPSPAMAEPESKPSVAPSPPPPPPAPPSLRKSKEIPSRNEIVLDETPAASRMEDSGRLSASEAERKAPARAATPIPELPAEAPPAKMDAPVPSAPAVGVGLRPSPESQENTSVSYFSAASKQAYKSRPVAAKKAIGLSAPRPEVITNVIPLEGRRVGAVASQSIQSEKDDSVREGDRLADDRQWDKAETSYRKALQRDPNDIGAAMKLGNALSQQKKTKAAIRCYERVLRLDPDHADAHLNLGDALVRLGRFDEAIKHYEHVLKINPKDVRARSGLASALQSLGRTDEAIAHWKQVLEIDPGCVPAQEALKKAMPK